MNYIMYTGLRTGIINDLHSGSTVSLKHPDSFNTNSGLDPGLNRYQVGLWEFWKSEIVPKFKNLDCLILNGDLCELMQPRNRMTETWSPDPIDQVVNVLRLISMLQPKKTYITRGTPYHVQDGALHVEELVGKYLNDGFDGTDVDEKYSFKIPKATNCIKYQNRFALEARLINLAPAKSEPRVFHITHHIASTSAWQYRGTAPSKAISTLMLNESHFIDRKIWKRITGILRAHVHHYWYEESANRMMLVNPAWQLQTPFMFKVMPESPPDIGACQIIIENDGWIHHRKHILDSKVTRPPVFRPFED